MPEIKPRKTQTKVKHTILKNYLNVWGGIIINGWRKNSKTLHLVYIDCNASVGRFNGELEDRLAKRKAEVIFGSPIIGVEMLDLLAAWARESASINICTNAILFEQEQNAFDELKMSLHMRGLTQRVRETEDFFSLQDGEIVLLCKDSTSMADKLIKYTQSGFTFSFFALDPYGPKGIPLSFVAKIVGQPRHDVLINVPYYDLHKKSGIVPKQNQAPVDEKLLKNYDEMFGNKEWRAVVMALDAEAVREAQEALHSNALLNDKVIEAGNIELDLMSCYKKSLLSADPELTVKSIGLHFPDKDRTIYYLCLTTHDPTGALQMNQVLWDAGYQEHELRWELKHLKKRGPQLALFELPVPEPETPQRTSIDEIAEQIRVLFKGKTTTLKSIYRALADELYFSGEIDRALTSLKRQKLAFFEKNHGINTHIRISGD